MAKDKQSHSPPPEDAIQVVVKSEMDALSRRTLVVLGIGAAILVLLFFLWQALGLLSLLFTSILLATFLRSISNLLKKHTRFSSGMALAIVSAVLVALLVLFIALLAPPLVEQFNQLKEAIPSSLEILEREVAQYEWGQQLYDQLTSFESLLADRIILDQLAGIFSSTVGILLSMALVLFVGIYLAIDPQLYLNGLLQLLPVNRRARYRQVLEACKTTLQWWLLGRALSMLAVGIMVSVGLWLMGIPLAFALGILAALLDFIPNVGPVLATAPAILIALVQNPLKALYVLLLYFVIQQVESYLITPIIQQKTVKLPPALTIIAQVLLTLLLGAVGLVIASPLLAVTIVIIRMLYVEDFLGDKPTAQPATNVENKTEEAETN